MKTTKMLQRPLLGGPFGDGKYSLATVPDVTNGLHSVRYLVMEHTGAVLAAGDDKPKVLAEARRMLCLLHAEAAANDPRWHQQHLWPELAPDTHMIAPARPISRRRREVFDRSDGRCHYCRTVLTLDGKWHVEHQKPRALGGNDDPANLVAACVDCNLAKSDKTAVQFIAAGGGSR